MSLQVTSKTQRLIVDAADSSVSIVSGGPVGPAGTNPTVNAYSGQGPFYIRKLGQAEYDGLTPDPNTIYLITGP